MFKPILRFLIKSALIVLAFAVIGWYSFYYINKSNNIYIGLGGVITQGDTLTVSLKVGVLNKLSKGAGLESVQFFIWQRKLDGLDVYLQSPDGMMVELASANGRGSSFYKNTLLSDDADSLLFTASAPFNGTYRPDQFLGWLNRAGKVKGKWKLRIVNRFPTHKIGVLLYWKLKFSDHPAQTANIEKSTLPLLVIETHQKAIKDKKKIKAELYIIDNNKNGFSYIKDSTSAQRSHINIEVRGFSSQRLPKKSYGFKTVQSDKTENNISILGLPADCDWVLNANCMDRSFARNTLMYELYRQMGYYSSRSRMVELVMNGQYLGIYVLNEKVKRATNRLADVEEFPAGFIIKLDTPRDKKPGWYSKKEGFDGKEFRCYFQYSYPGFEEIDAGHVKLIQQKINAMEMAIEDINDLDSLNAIINIKSFVDFLLMQEFSKNADAFNLSVYLYLNRNNQMVIGPIWDFDRSLGNGKEDRMRLTSGFRFQHRDDDAMHPVPMWWQNLMKKPPFRKLMQERWLTLRSGILSEKNINSHLDSVAAILQPVQQRNFKLWPVLGVARSNFYSDPSLNTYEKEIGDQKNWIHERLAWLDKQIPLL